MYPPESSNARGEGVTKAQPSNDLKFSVDGILALLRREGLRVTRSRRGIVAALFSAGRPLSLEEIQDRAAAEGGLMPDYATVFRMISLLEAKRIVHKVNLQRACSYYELSDPAKHHDHLVCTACGKVILLGMPCPVEDTERTLEQEYGFSEVSHSLEFFGRCPDCTVAVSGRAA